MIISWLAYAVVVAALVSVAGWLAERGARAQRWPTRWVWGGAMLVSVVGPLVAWLLPTAPEAAPVVGAPGAYVLGSLSSLTAGPAVPSGPSPETLVLVGWGVLSAALLCLLGVLAVRLERRGRRWPRRVVDGVEVLVSQNTGPAAMGVLRARVVVPEWALRLNATERRLLVLHEAEHVRARDPQLALVGLVFCVLAPWNLPLWWQLRRLRLAIEMDCDARVLRRSPDPRSYGSLLVTVGQRKAHLMLALAESPSMLERRIRMITNGMVGRRTLRAVALAGMAGLVLAVACETPGPTGPAPTPDDAAIEQQTLEAVQDEPTFTPMTVQPRVKNADEVREALARSYPPLLKNAGIGGTVNVWFLIDREGTVRQTRINKGADHPALDEAALKVADQMEFTPAYNRDERVPVWVALDITFEAGGGEGEAQAVSERGELSAEEREVRRTLEERGRELEAEEREVLRRLEERGRELEELLAKQQERRAREAVPPSDDSPADVAEKPTFTPMTEQPRLTNSQETARALDRYYPPLLRDAGIGGTANVWFFIDETGRVADVRINKSSGFEALDQAALRVAREMEFTPALNRDERVPVWVAIDILFEQ